MHAPARTAPKQPLLVHPPLPTIICLVGTARSGSTLLQRLIELHSDAIGLGEISRTRELLKLGYDCPCGEKLSACKFWLPALPFLAQATPLVAWGEARWPERFNMARTALATVAGRPWLASQQERESAHALGVALGSLGQAMGSRLFVDSSKELPEFLRLTLLPSHQVVPVLVIRDPRAVAWSGYQRTRTDPIIMGRHWVRLNRAAAALQRLTRGYPWQVVRYEDLCREPVSIVERVVAAAKKGPALRAPDRVSHAMGGSPGFALKSAESIAMDERWRVEMPERLQQDIMRTVGGTAAKFGYG